MSSHSGHSLARSIRRLAIDTVRDADARQRQVAGGAMLERDEQVQVKVSGRATDLPAWVTVDVAFDTVFTIATGNRQSNLQRPQVSFGYEITRTQRAPNIEALSVYEGIFITAYVRDWVFDEGTHAITGAQLAVGAYAPGDDLQFESFIHMTFQGLGSPNEPSDEAD